MISKAHILLKDQHLLFDEHYSWYTSYDIMHVRTL